MRDLLGFLAREQQKYKQTLRSATDARRDAVTSAISNYFRTLSDDGENFVRVGAEAIVLDGSFEIEALADHILKELLDSGYLESGN